MVKDSRRDERFTDNPNVTGDPFVIFYAGVPLVNSEGFALGTICIIDHKPRNLNSAQLNALKSLSNYVVELFEFRKNNTLLVEKRKMLEKKLYVMQQIGKVAMLGEWELELSSNELSWTSVTKEIH